MEKSTDRAETARQFAHLLFELRDELRQFMQRKFKENNIDLTYEMHQIMACLWRRDGVNQQELADLTLKDKASMTYLIDNLGKRDLVNRVEHNTDRRSKLIYLTAKGKQLGKKVEPWVLELFTIASRDFEIKAIQQSIKMVEKMRDNIKGG
ncbi:MAG TPA: MarR family transcriptional regulator [Chryseolinea sp.]|nr:MarR family transcriptional regulator [Chryseolinea sp.]